MHRTADWALTALFFEWKFIQTPLIYTVIGRSVGLDSSTETLDCAEIQRAYMSSKFISMTTDESNMIRYC